MMAEKAATSNNPVLIVKHEQEQEGTQARNELQKFFHGKILYGGLAVVGLVVFLFVGYTIFDNNGTEGGGSPTFWILLVIGLAVASAILPGFWGKASGAASILLILILIGVSFNPLIDRGSDYIQRGFNYGDWSEPAGYVRTVSNGTVKLTYESDRFFVVDSAEIWHDYANSCVSVMPPNVFRLIPEDEYGYRYRLEPKHGRKALAIVEVDPASECDDSSSS